MIKVTQELLRILFHSVRTSSDSLFHIGWGELTKREGPSCKLFTFIYWIKFNEGLSEAVSYLYHFDFIIIWIMFPIRSSAVNFSDTEIITPF
jgi:hypothetical protein